MPADAALNPKTSPPLDVAHPVSGVVGEATLDCALKVSDLAAGSSSLTFHCDAPARFCVVPEVTNSVMAQYR